jgi:hypothetical protein
MRSIVRNLECKLGKKEWEERAKRLAQLPQEVKREQDHLATLKTEARARIGKLEEEAKILAAAVRERVEFRDVRCEEQRLDELCEFRIIRLDTKEVLESRPMTSAELQAELPLEEDDDGPPEIAEPTGENAWADDALEAASGQTLVKVPKGNGDASDDDDGVDWTAGATRGPIDPSTVGEED